MEMLKLNRQGVILNAVMLAGLFAVIAGMIHRFVPAWQPGYLVVASFLVALEASLVHHIYRSEHMWVAELLRYLVPEIFVMLLLMRAAITLSLGASVLAEEAGRWLYDPLSIFDLPFSFAILAGFLIGALAHATMRDLFELAPRSSDSPEALADTNYMVAAMTNAERASALKRISSRFIFGGVVLLLMLALEAVNIEQLGGPSQPVSALSAGGALLYLVSGFLLYSQGRLALLQARWRLEGAQVAPTVSGRWTRVSWIIIAGVACVAALLPRTYGLGLLATIQGALGMIGAAIALIGYVITSILSLLAILPILLL
jgi:hypothetical protein